MVEELRLWRLLVAARVRSQWQYRASFLLYATASFLASVVDFAALAAIFAKVPQLGGWTIAEVAFLYGLTGLAFTLAQFAVGGVDELSRRVKDGTFDSLLLRPVGTITQLSAEGFALRRIGRVAQAGCVLALSLALLDVGWTAGRIAVTAATVAFGTLIYAAVFIATASIAFWVVEGRDLGNAFTYGGNFLSNQPLDIYARWLRRFATFVVPLAFTAYLPAAWVLGKTTAPDVPGELVWMTPLVAVVALLVAQGIWRMGLRTYRSTGT